MVAYYCFPVTIQEYLTFNNSKSIELEKKMFKVFMKYGWHKSLRVGLSHLDLTCHNNRQPWPELKYDEKKEIIDIIEEIKNEK